MGPDTVVHILSIPLHTGDTVVHVHHNRAANSTHAHTHTHYTGSAMI